MTINEKLAMRKHLFYFSMFYLLAAMIIGAVLTWHSKDVSAFAGLVGATAVALAGALSAHFATIPKDTGSK